MAYVAQLVGATAKGESESEPHAPSQPPSGHLEPFSKIPGRFRVSLLILTFSCIPLGLLNTSMFLSSVFQGDYATESLENRQDLFMSILLNTFPFIAGVSITFAAMFHGNALFTIACSLLGPETAWSITSPPDWPRLKRKRLQSLIGVCFVSFVFELQYFSVFVTYFLDAALPFAPRILVLSSSIGLMICGPFMFVATYQTVKIILFVLFACQYRMSCLKEEWDAEITTCDDPTGLLNHTRDELASLCRSLYSISLELGNTLGRVSGTILAALLTFLAGALLRPGSLNTVWSVVFLCFFVISLWPPVAINSQFLSLTKQLDIQGHALSGANPNAKVDFRDCLSSCRRGGLEIFGLIVTKGKVSRMLYLIASFVGVGVQLMQRVL